MEMSPFYNFELEGVISHRDFVVEELRKATDKASFDRMTMLPLIAATLRLVESGNERYTVRKEEFLEEFNRLAGKDEEFAFDVAAAYLTSVYDKDKGQRWQVGEVSEERKRWLLKSLIGWIREGKLNVDDYMQLDNIFQMADPGLSGLSNTYLSDEELVEVGAVLTEYDREEMAKAAETKVETVMDKLSQGDRFSVAKSPHC